MRTITTVLLVVGLIVVGAVLSRSVFPEAKADPAGQFKECITVKMNPHSYQHLNAGRNVVHERMVRIPEGWKPIGGSDEGVVLCR